MAGPNGGRELHHNRAPVGCRSRRPKSCSTGCVRSMVVLAHFRVAGALLRQRERVLRRSTGAVTWLVHCPQPQSSVRLPDHRFQIAPATPPTSERMHPAQLLKGCSRGLSYDVLCRPSETRKSCPALRRATVGGDASKHGMTPTGPIREPQTVHRAAALPHDRRGRTNRLSEFPPPALNSEHTASVPVPEPFAQQA